MLLETIYKAFDDIAVKMGVFKVETVGGKSHECSWTNSEFWLPS